MKPNIKNNIDDLAIFGAKPTFTDAIHVGRPNLPDRKTFLDLVNGIFDRRWLTNKGPLVLELEKRIAAYLGVKHCICVSNATVALEIMVKAMGLTGEVICPSFTFVATAHALQWLGVRPIFCDIDAQTHNIDPKQIEKLITDKTSGILGVHLWGRPCAIKELEALARKHHLKLFFDAAHAFGVTANGEKIGSFGQGEVFSFHATKLFNTFEGGAITTNNDELAERCHLLKNFGIKGYDQIWMAGINAKMSEVHAAMGLAMLDILPEIIEKNKEHYRIYQEILGKVNGIQLLTYDEKENNNFQYVVLEIDQEVSGIRRNQLIKIMHAENILARRYFYPGCHRVQPYCEDETIDHRDLINTETVSERVICLPTGTGVTPEEVEAVAKLLIFIVENGKAITEQLTSDKVKL